MPVLAGDRPPHMRFEYVKRLAKKQPNPAMLARYLLDVVSDDEAFASAVTSMVRIPVGFHSLYVSQKPRIQLNFYHDSVRGNEDPHGHARWAHTNWYAPPGAVQTIVRHQPLRPGTRRFRGLPIEELRTMPNNVMEAKSGGRPVYGLVPLRMAHVLVNSVTTKMPLSGEDFMPWEVHNVKIHQLARRVAVSTHVKGRREPAGLSTFDGLVDYKRMHPDDAEQLLAVRADLETQIAEGEMPGIMSLGPATMIYVPPDRNIADMEPIPVATPPRLAEELILGGLRTAQELARQVA